MYINMTTDQKELAVALFKAGTFKLGKFYTKSGLVLNAYFDLLAIFSHPWLMDKICENGRNLCENRNIDCHSVCGVTYGGIPFGVLLASKLQKPLLTRIKEIFYSPKGGRIEGNICENDYCLIVEEVIASGNSVLEMIKDIEDTGMKVKDVFTIIDLEQGATENLEKAGYKLHSLLKMSQLAKILLDEKLITEDQFIDICKGFAKMFSPNCDCITDTNLGIKKFMPYEERVNHCKSKMAQKLFKLMSTKKNNLCVDFETEKLSTLLQVAERIGPFICILIVHLDAINDIEEFQLEKLKETAIKYNFLIMDNRKLSEDDEGVMIEQCRKIFKIADLLSIQPLPGENILHKARSVINEFPDKGIFIDAFPNIIDALVGSSFERSAIALTLNLFDEAIGFMSHKNSEFPIGYVHMMSDVKNTASVVQKKNNVFYSPETIISDICADVILLQYDDVETVEESVKRQQTILWNAYVNRIGRKIIG